jgi:hypothetical protein
VQRGQCVPRREQRLLDLIFVAATIGFFAVAFAYARACDRV